MLPLEDGVTGRKNLEGRTFYFQIMRLQNGCVVSISEGKPKLGSLTVSLYNGSVPVTTQVIPARSANLLARLAAEKIAVRMNGIAVLSIYVNGDISSDMTKEILKEIDAMISS